MFGAKRSIGACIMDAVTLVIFVAFMAYLVGRMAERRGRSFKNWALIAAVLIGPLAIPLLFLFPNLHGKNGGPA
jgi:ABC-type glycerol-3-phosphate transport system permease component